MKTVQYSTYAFICKPDKRYYLESIQNVANKILDKDYKGDGTVEELISHLCKVDVKYIIPQCRVDRCAFQVIKSVSEVEERGEYLTLRIETISACHNPEPLYALCELYANNDIFMVYKYTEESTNTGVNTDVFGLVFDDKYVISYGGELLENHRNLSDLIKAVRLYKNYKDIDTDDVLTVDELETEIYYVNETLMCKKEKLLNIIIYYEYYR